MWTKWSLRAQVPLNRGSKAVLLRRNVLVTKTLSSQGPKHLATFHQLWWPCKKTPFGRGLRPHDRTTLHEKRRPKQQSSGTSSFVCLQNQDDKKEASGREPQRTPPKLLKPMYECMPVFGTLSDREGHHRQGHKLSLMSGSRLVGTQFAHWLLIFVRRYNSGKCEVWYFEGT